ncbi:hypothetical protein MPSEU_000614900 [Mayamaea pseudoterrestris]|nr:hypothetical protein MPSEU_000614900 [Mayamaea pseudoterrestris]
MTFTKVDKEAFVTGHKGSTPWEILLIISTTPIGLLFFQAVTNEYNDFIRRDWQLIVWEAVSFEIPMILCQSNLLYPYGVSYLLVQLVIGFRGRLLSHGSKCSRHVSTHPQQNVNKATLTIYRASVMFLTFIAILAVDFHVFPRRFVKTETQGYSLMDVGAASFVFAAGLVSARSRGRTQSKRKTMSRMVPLLIMGLVRLLTHKGLDYQEHVSEYGVHWNFFFTLAMLSPTSCLFPGPSLVVPVALLTFYQASLSFGMQEWVLEAPRTCQTANRLCSLFVANREGILGCIGYGALYLVSEWIGNAFVWRTEKPKNRMLLVAVLGACWFVLTAVLQIPVSRRTTNAPFVIWILLINILQLFAIEWAAGSECRVPLLFEAVNDNGLVMFVVANLLTGLINLSIDTLSVANEWALSILILYIHVVGGMAYGLKVVSRAIQTSQLSNEKDA